MTGGKVKVRWEKKKKRGGTNGAIHLQTSEKGLKGGPRKIGLSKGKPHHLQAKHPPGEPLRRK